MLALLLQKLLWLKVGIVVVVAGVVSPMIRYVLLKLAMI